MTRDDEHPAGAQIQRAFADVLGAPPPHGDPLAGVGDRIGRIERRRTIVATAVVTISVVGAAAAIYGVTRPAASSHPDRPASQVVAIDPQLSLRVTAARTVAAGGDEQITVVLTGTGEPAASYGFRVAWGDGGLDRVFGSDDCRPALVGPLHVTRVFEHHYLQPGHERIVVELTRCGFVQARTITRILVTPEH